MSADRLALALRELEAGDWLIFERFAATFLAVEFPSLRTMAATAGDKGRDGQLFLTGEAPKTVFQYSVSVDWRAKIRRTAVTLAGTMPQVTRLIYCTNQTVGPEADSLVEEFRRKGVSLDVRDRSWFVERQHTAAQRQIAAEDLCARIVDPLLGREGITAMAAPSLTDEDARIALLHLTLQGYDEKSNRNLTRSCFEALVVAALHGTSANELVTAGEIESAVRKLVPVGNREQIQAHIDGALKRLSSKGGPVKYVKKNDAYHLSFEAQQRNADWTASFLSSQRQVEDELFAAIIALGVCADADRCRGLAVSLRGGLEEVLLQRGESFARAVAGGVMNQIDVREVLSYLTAQGQDLAPLSGEAAAEVVMTLLEEPSAVTQAHLGRLADGYTLFAFLQQTPDVQKTVISIFSGGEIWLDTTIVLPLFAETLIDDPLQRHYTVLLGAALDAGFRLYVTDGIVEELERHLNRALICARTSTETWRSGVPFIYAAYTLSGRPRTEFYDWLTEFRGMYTPEEDIKEYLEDVSKIRTRNLLDESDGAPLELRAAVQEIWYEAHERRRQCERSDIVPEIASRLVAHDVECTVGVIQLRKEAERSPTGYTEWWLTLDHVGFTLKRELQQRLSGAVPQSPALSPDFLSQLLRLGPLRSAIEGEKHLALPILTTISRYEALPTSLIELADEVRKRFQGQSERVIRRQVRDSLNELRWRQGEEAQAGVRGAEERVKSRLAAQAERGALT